MEIVSFEIAKKLKEKGFKWTCSHYYRTKCKDLFMVFPCEDWSDIEERINAPTISQVLKWLREEKKLHIMIDIWKVDINDTLFNWGYDIVNLITTKVVGSDISCANTYELAAIAGIEYIIDNNLI